MMSHLNEISQITPRSSVVSSSVNFCRQICSSSLTKHPDSYHAFLKCVDWWWCLVGTPLQSNLVTITDWRAMFAELQKESSSIMCIHMNATVLTLPIQGVAYAECLCQCPGREVVGWLLPPIGRKVPRSWRCHWATADASRVSPNFNHRHCSESCTVHSRVSPNKNHQHFSESCTVNFRVSPNSNHQHFSESCSANFCSSTTIDKLLSLLEWVVTIE